MPEIIIKILDDFTSFPGPRLKKEGEFSGQLFRETILYPKMKEAITKNLKIIVNLDGTSGYGTSFLEESFGGLIRENNIDYSDIKKRLVLISSEEDYLINDIEKYLEDAFNEKNKQ